MTPANDNRPPQQRPAGFDAALVAYIPMLRRKARMLTRDNERAEDLLQETILNAINRAATCRMETFKTWVKFVMTGTWSVATRSARRRRQSGSDISIDAAVDDVSPLENRFKALSSSADQDERTDLRRAIDRLSTIPNGDILLRRAMGESLEEIGDELNITREAVRQREERAREKLRAA